MPWQKKVTTSIDSYYMWKKFFVTNPNYKLVHDIEEIYGTSLSLYHSSLRANNFEYSEMAKKVFSPLFHVNNNINYLVMDIHTEYLTTVCSRDVPELHDYLASQETSLMQNHMINDTRSLTSVA
jgi:hypothetical protein